jgi:hypothetical protein
MKENFAMRRKYSGLTLKEAIQLTTDRLTGVVDYLLTPRLRRDAPVVRRRGKTR